MAMLRGKGGKMQPVRFSRRGVSDIIGFTRDGHFLAVECKASDGKLRPEQEEFLGKVKKAGGFSAVARSVDELHEAYMEWSDEKLRPRS